MLNVTEKAAALLRDELDDNTSNTAEMFRLVGTDEGFALTIGEAQGDDQVVTFEEREILAIDQALAPTLDGSTLDATDTTEGPRLVLQSATQR